VTNRDFINSGVGVHAINLSYSYNNVAQVYRSRSGTWKSIAVIVVFLIRII